MKIICGLGNPGAKYTNTRHNVGFMLIDELAKDVEFKEKWNALVAEITLNGEKTLLIKPLTFMNLSGRALSKFVNFYKLEPTDLTLVYDDIDLSLGDLRYREKGGAGTHNGMKSIIQELGTQEFPRLRIGIESRGDTAPEQMDISDFVLAPFSEEELTVMKESIRKALKILENPLA